MDEHAHSIGRMPVWVVVALLGGAAVVGYFLFVRGKSSSGGGGATGYSAQGLAVMQNPDESASISLMNQEMSTFQDEVQSQISSFEQGTYTGLGQISSAVSTTGGTETTDLNSLLGQMGDMRSFLDSFQQGTYTGLGQVSAAGSTDYGSIMSYLQALANAQASQQNAQSSTPTTGTPPPQPTPPAAPATV